MTCDALVAQAAPAIPQPNPVTNHKSSTRLSTVVSVTALSGVHGSRTAKNADCATALMIPAGSANILITLYALA